MRGVEEEIGVFSTDVDDDGMLFPCLDFTLRVREMFKNYRVLFRLAVSLPPCCSACGCQ